MRIRWSIILAFVVFVSATFWTYCLWGQTVTNRNNNVWTGTNTFQGSVTFSIAPSYPTQSANTILAGPTSGGAAAPAFRALVMGDFPSSGTLPAYNASALTNLDATDLSGNLPALNGSALTNLTAGNLTGTYAALNGSAITSLSAANLTGSIADARLSANVPLLNASNTFTGTTNTVYNSTPTTGVTTVSIRAGAGQSSTNILQVVRASDGSASRGNAVLFTASGTQIAADIPLLGGGTSTQWYFTSSTFRLASGMIVGWSSSPSNMAGSNPTEYFGRSGDDAVYLRTDRTTSVAPTFELQGKSDTNSGRKVATLATAWATATDASRKGRFTLNVSDATADRNALTAESDGSTAYVAVGSTTVDATAKLYVAGAIKGSGNGTFAGQVSAATFSGNGSGLTNVPAPTAISFAAYLTGTAYTLTATYAAVTGGTTSPSITITSPGTYMIQSRCKFDNNGAAASAIYNTKLRRTNNTAADLANSLSTMNDDFGNDGFTNRTMGGPQTVIYTTANSDDVITIFARDLGGAPGSTAIQEAFIVAVKIGS